MKKLHIFTVLFIGLCFFAKAQDIEPKTNYSFDNLYTYNDVQFKTNYKLKVISVDSTQVCFIVYPFKGKKDPELTKQLNAIYYETNNQIIKHCIPKEEFEQNTSRVYSAFKGVRAGFYTIPFKLRFDKFDFEQNVNFGMNIGFQYRFNKKIEDRWLYEPSFGIGLSSIQLNSKNSNVTEDRSASAFTLTSGIIIHFDNVINLGIFGGIDLLGNSDRDTNWKYHGKPWLGIGINIGFALSKAEDNGLNNNPDKD